MKSQYLYDFYSFVNYYKLTRSLVLIHAWIKIVRAHQPWSNLYISEADDSPNIRRLYRLIGTPCVWKRWLKLEIWYSQGRSSFEKTGVPIKVLHRFLKCWYWMAFTKNGLVDTAHVNADSDISIWLGTATNGDTIDMSKSCSSFNFFSTPFRTWNGVRRKGWVIDITLESVWVNGQLAC